MKFLPISLLVGISVITVSSVNAQEANSASGFPLQSQSSSLMTHPASVNQPDRVSGQRGQPLNTNKLNSIADSISVKPTQKPKEPSIIPDGVIPDNLILRRELKPVDPIADFKAPPLNRGLQVPIGKN